MIEKAPRDSAKIYQFPIGGQASFALQRDAATSVSMFKPAPVATTMVVDSWYHDEAIQQEAEQQTRKR